MEGALSFAPSPALRKFDLDSRAIRLLADAENAIGRLTGTTSRLVNPYLVGSPLLHREAILSSKIEGTITTPEQLVLLEAGEAGQSPTREPPNKDTQEVLNYIKAMNHGLNRLRELPVCLRLIREIHAELLGGVRGERERPGEFRTSQNWIGRPGESIHRARFVPPPVQEMMAALDDFEKYLNEDTEDLALLVKLALLHYQFETIHPFRDGNGRIGRLLIPLLLCNHKRIGQPVLYLSWYFERHRDAYMDLLLAVSLRGEWLEWVHFFLNGVIACAEEAIGQAEGLLRLRQQYVERVQKARSSGLLQKLIDRLFQLPSITIGQAAELLEITHVAAGNNIRKLQDVDILKEVTGRQRGQVFIANAIVAVMRDTETTQPTAEAAENVVRTQVE
jgi:Fic family protein